MHVLRPTASTNSLSEPSVVSAGLRTTRCADFFLTGGTQTNATTIDSMLYQYEGVICVGTGHINVHEAGAVEFTEHKIITLPDNHGKMEARVLKKYLDDFMADGNRNHAVHPGLVYITFPTELGTLYTARELDDIYQVCRNFDIPLYIDGARLGYGLMAEDAISPCPIWLVIATCFTSVAQRLVPSVARLWYSHR
ncbi:beta-eliminating lyase-related protein [Prevotella communis]|uniref:beta-eliminating lyase-related protein n=1 Tax=Prevotella communis TaxID=2913614 RepID=UPI001EDA1D1A|nr:beta-eliminating lyase-related protein [Prevotella communis]UKK67755.1 beta-eliminating lyase-related protein [Prevotella communis]